MIAIWNGSTIQRRSMAAVAVIRRRVEGRALFLGQWNPAWKAIHFVSGHRRPAEMFRECMVRELFEELGLEVDVDYDRPRVPLDLLGFQAWSENAGVLTSYTMAVYEIALKTPSTLAKVAANPDNHWLSGDEIELGRCEDGLRVSPTMKRILTLIAKRAE